MCTPRDKNRSLLSKSLAWVKMDAGEVREKSRMSYYKNLRKKQKRHRKERKREEERVRREEMRKRQFRKLVENIRKKVAAEEEPQDELEMFDPEMVEEAFHKSNSRNQSLEEERKSTQRKYISEKTNKLKEIQPRSLVKLGKVIGSGTFGVCHLARYRGITVAVKELKSKGNEKAQIKKQRKEAFHEANILASLGDHPGLPPLFGVQTKTLPFRLILQFHGDKNGSLTLWQAASNLQLTNHAWMNVVGRVGDALKFMHSQDVIHNDLKPNDVVLEKRGQDFNPVIIDFGKSLYVEEAKKRSRCLPHEDQRKHLKKYPYVAPELVNGGYPSAASDTYSFAKIVDFLCKEKSCLHLSSAELTLAKNSALGPDPTKRPALEEFLGKLS